MQFRSVMYKYRLEKVFRHMLRVPITSTNIGKEYVEAEISVGLTTNNNWQL